MSAKEGRVGEAGRNCTDKHETEASGKRKKKKITHPIRNERHIMQKKLREDYLPLHQVEARRDTSGKAKGGIFESFNQLFSRQT